MIATMGGRKFVLSFIGIAAISLLAVVKADATAFGSIALIVGAYNGANGFIEGKYSNFTHRRPRR